MDGKPFRVLPRVTPETEFFWTSGADGRLRFLRCQDDGTFVHPPAPVCPRCLGRQLAPEVVSGRGTVHSHTVNHKEWYPGLTPPYVIAVVAIEEDPTVRLMTNVIGCPPDDVHIGMAVRVTFDHYDDVWLPMFEPVGEG